MLRGLFLYYDIKSTFNLRMIIYLEMLRLRLNIQTLNFLWNRHAIKDIIKTICRSPLADKYYFGFQMHQQIGYSTQSVARKATVENDKVLTTNNLLRNYDAVTTQKYSLFLLNIIAKKSRLSKESIENNIYKFFIHLDQKRKTSFMQLPM